MLIVKIAAFIGSVFIGYKLSQWNGKKKTED